MESKIPWTVFYVQCFNCLCTVIGWCKGWKCAFIWGFKMFKLCMFL